MKEESGEWKAMSAWGLERGRQTRGRRKARVRRKGNRGKKKKE